MMEITDEEALTFSGKTIKNISIDRKYNDFIVLEFTDGDSLMIISREGEYGTIQFFKDF